MRDLTRLPHRGAATIYEKEAIDLLTSVLRRQKADVAVEPFRTPHTYINIVYWLTASQVFGLLTLPYLGPVSVMVTWLSVVGAWLYFNWRYSPVTQLPPTTTSHNIIGRWKADETRPEPSLKLILMAHYDTAPISLLYQPGQVGSFRLSLIGSLVMMLLSGIWVTVNLFDLSSQVLTYARWAFAAYFVLLAILTTLGYWLYGYTNGASDNATGVAAALATAERMRQHSLPGLDLEVVLTGAEEVGMIGARHYLEKHIQEWPLHRTAVINFDTLGNGKLHLIRETGTVEAIRYTNELFLEAEKLMALRDFRENVAIGDWHTADFDSVWFVREGIPVITLTALDRNGQMPNIHRKEDQLMRTNLSAIGVAVDLAEQTLVRYYQSLATATKQL